MSTRLRPWFLGACLGLIVVAALVLRFVDLPSNPGGLFPDEAAEGVSAERLLHEPGYHPVFFADGGGREALFAYVVAAVFSLTGQTTLALRATAAGVGVLGVLAIWLLGRRFGPGVGLVAAGWAAGSLWLVAVSRDGMRNAMVPLFGALALVALIGWADRPSRRSAALAGAIVSVATLYTYQPLKLLPLLVLVWLAWVRRVDRPAYAQLRHHVGTFIVVFVAVGAPMFASAIVDPAAYFGRAVGVTPLNVGVQGDSSPVVHVLRTVGMFALTGDPNARHNVSGWPLFGWPPLGWVLALGTAAGIARLWRCRRGPAHALVLWSLPVFLLPPLIAVEGGSPHFLRTLGLAAPLGVTIGLGTLELVEREQSGWGRWAARTVVALATAVLIVLAAANGQAYLSRPVEERFDAYSFPLVALATAAGKGDGQAVIVDDYEGLVVRFLAGDRAPVMVPPDVVVDQPAEFTRILAIGRDRLDRALEPALASTARPIAWGPDGQPSVWAVSP